jgi:hypothetical protein
MILKTSCPLTYPLPWYLLQNKITQRISSRECSGTSELDSMFFRLQLIKPTGKKKFMATLAREDEMFKSIMHLGWPTSKIEAPPLLLNWKIEHRSPNTKGQLPCKGVGICGHGKEKRVQQQRTTCCREHRRWVWALDCLQLWRQNGRDTDGPLLCANYMQRKGKWNYQSQQENLHLVKSKLMK